MHQGFNIVIAIAILALAGCSSTPRDSGPLPAPPGAAAQAPRQLAASPPRGLATTATPAGASQSAATAAAPNVTDQVERLGNPFQKGPYARNVWDMQLFNGRIFLGHGNSSNEGPEQNAGPIPVWYYDLQSGRFVNHYTVAEEQIDLYRIIDRQLYIPGHDPRGSHNGNIYRLESGTWRSFSVVPDAVHLYDLAFFDNRWFASTGTFARGRLAVSDDGGKTWSYTLDKTRGYTLFTLQGDLYSASYILVRHEPRQRMIYRYHQHTFSHAVRPAKSPPTVSPAPMVYWVLLPLMLRGDTTRSTNQGAL